MRKVYLGIIVAAVAGIVYTVVTSYTDLQPSLVVSADRNNFTYYEVAKWSAKGLPPNADYKTMIVWKDGGVISGGGTADSKGEANGSFMVGDNIPSGAFTLRVELASNAKKFGEVMMNVAS